MTTLDANRFSVQVENSDLPGVQVVDLPKRSTEVEVDQNGNRLWGSTEYTDLILTRAVQTDDSTLFDWRQDVEAGKVTAGRKTVTVSLLDANGNSQIEWEFTNAWPKEYEPPNLDATGNGVAIESVVIAHEGVKRTL